MSWVRSVTDVSGPDKSEAGGVRSQIRTCLHCNSLLTGKLTGNFAILGPQKPISLHETAVLQRLFTKFPTQINRENILKNREISGKNREIW